MYIQTINKNDINSIPCFDLTEIINGLEIMGPSPFLRHQDISRNILEKILLHLRKNNTGKIYYSPLDVIFEEGINRLQPDLVFVKNENMDIVQDWIRGVPDMVCEIVSDGSYSMDIATKKDIYERYKVPEYWIVIPKTETVTILTIENGQYKIFSFSKGQGVVRSKVIEGLEINISDIF